MFQILIFIFKSIIIFYIVKKIIIYILSKKIQKEINQTKRINSQEKNKQYKSK